MNTQQQIEERLWDYIDGLSSPAEISAVESLIAENREWQEKYRELLNIHQALHTSELETPSMRFTKNVMEEIARYQVAPATKTYINKNVIRGIGAFFLSMITGLLVFCLSQLKWSSGSSKPLVQLPSIDKLSQDLDKFNYIKVFNSGWFMGFLFLLIVTGWIWLDMYLAQKRHSTSL
ncbi:MAG: hypothetical protein JST68_28630 [Bacteroidetes bacterium]|nr:hypothetical protein [Bacteroidota bacterium]